MLTIAHRLNTIMDSNRVGGEGECRKEAIGRAGEWSRRKGGAEGEKEQARTFYSEENK